MLHGKAPDRHPQIVLAADESIHTHQIVTL
jgi:hypothetical protein